MLSGGGVDCGSEMQACGRVCGVRAWQGDEEERLCLGGI